MDWLKNIANPSEQTHHLFKSLMNNLAKIILQSVAILFLVIMVITPLVWWLTKPISTQIQVDLIVNRVTFRVGEIPAILKTIKFHAATFRDFNRFVFNPTAITNQDALALDTVQISGKDERFLPTMTLETVNPTETDFGVLQTLAIAPKTDVTIAMGESEGSHGELAIEMENSTKSSLATMRYRGAFQVKTHYCEIDGVELPANFEVTSLSRRNPALTVTGQPNSFRLMLSVPAEQAFELFQSGISITELHFIWEDIIQGQKVIKTALVEEGEISYPAYPGIEPIRFAASNFVFFGKVDVFQINKVTYDPENKGIKIRLSGLIEEPLTTYPQGFPDKVRDYRLTRADTIAQGSKFRQVMFEILLWLIPIITGVVGIVTINIVKIRPEEE
ncbi:membrane protein [Beggiatoa sp. PS]|nr:membrane protein [Beggiatoa sp. PS]